MLGKQSISTLEFRYLLIVIGLKSLEGLPSTFKFSLKLAFLLIEAISELRKLLVTFDLESGHLLL